MSRIPAPPITEPGMQSDSDTIWGLPDTSLVNPTSDMILRKTNLFGVLIKDKETGKVLLPDDPRIAHLQKTPQGLIDFKAAKNFALQNRHDFDLYYPDVLNDLRLSDHAPLIQETAEGRVASFNIMYQCESTFYAGKPGFNNAHQKIETPENYAKRLDLLADFIIQMVKENKINVLTLQETPSINSKEGKQFFEKINKALPEHDIVPGENGLATLFNKDAFNLVSAHKDNHNRELHTQFTNKHTGEELTVINVHWKLNDAASNADRAHQLLSSGKRVMIMGDTNICANDTARKQLDGATQANHEIAMKHLSPHPGMHAPVEDDLEAHSKKSTTTMDMILVSQILANLYTRLHSVHNVPSHFQSTVEGQRQQNFAALPPKVREFFWHFTEVIGKHTPYPGNVTKSAMTVMAATPSQPLVGPSSKPLAVDANELIRFWNTKFHSNPTVTFVSNTKGDFVNFNPPSTEQANLVLCAKTASGIQKLLGYFYKNLSIQHNTNHQNFSIRFSHNHLNNFVTNLTKVITDYETAKKNKSFFQSFSKESAETISTFKKILSGEIVDDSFTLKIKSGSRLEGLLKKHGVTIHEPPTPAPGMQATI